MNSTVIPMIRSLLLVIVGLYLLSLSMAYFLEPVGLAHFRSINSSLQTFLLGPAVAFMGCAQIAIWMLEKKPYSTGVTVLLLIMVTCVGIALYLFVLRYIPFLIATYHDSSPQGIEKSRSLGYGLHLLALRTIPFGTGTIMIWTGLKLFAANLSR
jgi:hypothetical protein